MLFPVTDSLRIKDILTVGLALTLDVFTFIVVAALARPPLYFLLNIVEFMKKSDGSDRFIEATYGFFFILLLIACLYTGVCISCHMVSPYGYSIEKFITYVMGGTSIMDEDRYMVPRIRSADRGLLLDLPKLPTLAALPITDRKGVIVNKKTLAISCCAFAIIQIALYLMGHKAGVRLQDEPCPNIGILTIASSSLIWVSLFKLFAASHQYNLMMAKLVMANSIVFEIVSLVHNAQGGFFTVTVFIMDLCVGAIPILVALYCMRNPVDKLYTIYYDKSQVHHDLEAAKT